MVGPLILSSWQGKSSVRSKTSAFLGKIIGQGSIRDKVRLSFFNYWPRAVNERTFEICSAVTSFHRQRRLPLRIPSRASISLTMRLPYHLYQANIALLRHRLHLLPMLSRG